MKRALSVDGHQPNQRSLSTWQWWESRGPELQLRHAVRIVTRAGALEDLVFQGGPPLDRALQSYQRSNPAMGRNDRLLLGAAAYALARNREVYREERPGTEGGTGFAMLLALLDAQCEPGDLGRVPHLPSGVRPWSDALERVAASRASWSLVLGEGWDQPISDLAAAVLDAFARLFSLPSWWLEEGPWLTLGGAIRELSALKVPQSLTLRAQAHRACRDDVLIRLANEGIRASATDRSPWGIRIEGRYNVLATPLFRTGVVEVQDEGSQLIACLCDPKPGEKVLDLCAGGGGKTLALAAAMGGKGAVIAHDPDPRRLADTRTRARRASLGNIRILQQPEELFREGPYDLVLADVPCSSSGTLRRNPDVSWRWSRQDLDRLTALQRDILGRAADLVRPGGYLVYSTCSLFERENGEAVRGFLLDHPNFAAEAPGGRRLHATLLDIPGAASGAFRIPADLPRYSGDAFFLARLRRDK